MNMIKMVGLARRRSALNEDMLQASMFAFGGSREAIKGMYVLVASYILVYAKSIANADTIHCTLVTFAIA
jgi:hypothetical protein